MLLVAILLPGVAADPRFAANRQIYLYYTAKADSVREIGAMTHNRITRWTLGDDNRATGETTLIDRIASA